MSINSKLLEIIACPICHTELSMDLKNNKLICNFDNFIFPIKQGIPIFLINSHKNSIIKS